MRAYLKSLGFHRVIALRPSACGLDHEAATLWLCLWAYGEGEEAGPDRAVVHPYYPASQRAYAAARQAVAEGERRGLHLIQDTELRLKPIFAHLQGFDLGRNTLSRVEGMGSRFHAQALWMQEPAEAYDDGLWQEAPQGVNCGACRACLTACPTGALDEAGFHRERCLRNWMLGGQPVPEELRAAMGNLLLGCDACQRCCPHNAGISSAPCVSVDLAELLRAPKEIARALAPEIGYNLALPNRVLGQALLLAGNSGEKKLLSLVTPWMEHPSPLVREHARWAADRLAGIP